MDAERLLISKMAQTGRVQKLMLLGIGSEHFNEDSSREIFEFCAEHAKNFRQAPSFKTVRESFPEYNFEISDESFDYILDQFQLGLKRRYSIQAIRDLADAVDNDELAKNIDFHFLEKARELTNMLPASQVHRFKDIDKRILEYENYDETKDESIKMGIAPLDEITLGIQPHEYATIMGWSGTGKSTLAQWILFNAWMKGKTPMYISLEMEAKALFRKWDTMAMHFKYNDLKSHNLREEEIEAWKKKAVDIKNHPSDIIVMDDIREFTVDRAYAELVRWSPDILCVDYITLMNTPKSAGAQSWERVQHITQNLKSISRTLKIPIIGVAQTNRESASLGAELNNVAFGLSIIQDSDIVLGLYQDKDGDMKKNKQMTVKLLKNRDGMTQSTDLHWDMDTMSFGPFSEAQAIASFSNEY
jgi:replicative DNA helicase